MVMAVMASIFFLLVALYFARVGFKMGKQWLRSMRVPDDLRRADDGIEDAWPPNFGYWVNPPDQ